MAGNMAVITFGNIPCQVAEPPTWSGYRSPMDAVACKITIWKDGPNRGSHIRRHVRCRSPDMSKDAQARLPNVYLRPWTLDLKCATPHVPHISALDLEIRSTDLNPGKRLFTKTAPGPRSHHLAWRAYIQHHVVSEHAARTIRNFLSATECDPEEVDLAETPAKPTDHEVDTTWVTPDTIDKLVRGVGFEYSKRSGPAVRRIVEEWESNPQVDTANTWYVNTGITDIKLDRSQSKTQQPTPLSETEPLRWTYGKLTPEAATAWLQRLAEQGLGGSRCSRMQCRAALSQCRTARSKGRAAGSM